MSIQLEKDQEAPIFRALNQDNKLLHLSDYLGEKNVVLYFYPKDDTPGCTIEANDFTALAGEFSALSTVIIGVSKDDCASHRAFISKYGLDVQLLADTLGEICDSYGVWQEVEKTASKNGKSSGLRSLSIKQANWLRRCMALTTKVMPKRYWR